MDLRSIAFCLAVALGGHGGPLAMRASSSDAARLIRVPHGGIQPEAVLDARRVLHVLYFAGEPRAGDLFYVQSADYGSTFSKPIRVNSQGRSAIATGTIRGGQLAIGRDGRAHVVWNGSNAAQPRGGVHPATGRAGMPLLYTRSNRDGTAFEPQRGLMRRTYNLDGGGAVAADEAGNVYAAWHGNDRNAPDSDEGARRVWLARSTDDGRTFTTESAVWPEPTGACGCCGMRMLAPSRDVVYLLYRSASDLVNRDLYLLTSPDRGVTFRGARIHEWDVAACPMTSMSLIGAGSRVYGAWETGGQVFLAPLAPGAAVEASPVAPPGAATGRKHPRAAANAAGDVFLAWTEGAAWGRAGILRWQLFDRSGKAVGPGGGGQPVPVWSFPAVVARPDGFTIIY